MNMLKALLFVLSVFCYGVGLNAFAAEQNRGLQPLQKPTEIPRVIFSDGKKPLELSVFKGRYLLVNFWATWCSPCLSEMPSLDRLAKKLAKENITVVAISEDEGGVTQVRR